MELSNSVDSVELMDLKWAVDTGYEKDEIWVLMNAISLMSNKPRTRKTINQFRELTGKNLWCPATLPARNWSGSYDDLILAVIFICGKHARPLQRNVTLQTEFLRRIHCNKDDKEMGIRLRTFSNIKNNPVFGQSAQLKVDENGRFYMWDWDANKKLVQIPEQLLKERLIEWGESHSGEVSNGDYKNQKVQEKA